MTDTLVGRLQEALKQWWSFDDRQRHTHSWHTRTDFIYTELPKLVAPFEAEIERLTADVARIKIQRSNALLDMEEFMNKAAAAESSLSEAVKALEPFAKAYEEPHCEALGLVTITVKQKDLRRASAIRSRAAVLEQK